MKIDLWTGKEVNQNSNMLPMTDKDGKRYAILYEPGHRYHGWIFYDNHGSWVTYRMGLMHEVMRASRLAEDRLRNVPQQDAQQVDMPTSKSPRPKRNQSSRWARYNANPENLRRRAESVRAAKQALPREYPAYRPGDSWFRITIEGPGGVWYTLDALIPPERGRVRPRSDQATVIENDIPWTHLGTKTSIVRRVFELIPRRFTRDELATLDDFAGT